MDCRHSRFVEIAARAAVVGTFLLIALGGIVTSLDVGMAVPDWPTTMGDSMFAYSLAEMLESWGVTAEHSHRLMGTVVGFLSIALAVISGVEYLRGRTPGALAGASLSMLLLVIAQGLVGALRVLQNDRAIAIFHALGAQLVLCGFTAIAVLASRPFRTAEEYRQGDPSAVERLRLWSLVTLAVLFVHLWAGAGLRHQQANFLGHLLLAGLVTALCLVLLALLLGPFREVGWLRLSAHRLLTLLGLQLALGLGAWAFKYGPPAAQAPIELHATLATAHLVVGAGMFAILTALVLQAWGRLRLPAEGPFRLAGRPACPAAEGGAA